jgi:hypothetical protein
MTETIEINDEPETIEISLAEYEALSTLALRIGEQNTLVLDGIKALRDEMVAQAENLTATFASLVDAIGAMQINVTTPAPIVNLPEIIIPPAEVRVTMPKPKMEKQTVKRNRDGLIESTETKIEY